MAFLIADRWQGVSPAEVEDWPEQMVSDAMIRIEAEGAYQKREKARGDRSRSSH